MQDSPIQIDILLFDAFSNLCLANAVEPFRAANMLSRFPLYRWRYLTLNGRAVRSSSGLSVMPHDAMTGQTGAKLMVVSSYNHLGLDCPETRQKLAAAAMRYKALVGLDSGAWLLASAGLLNGNRATIHRDLMQSFTERFLQVDPQTTRFVIDNNRITCGGALASFDLILEIIRRDQGAVLASDVARLFLHSAHDLQVPTDPVQAARHLMQTHIETPLTIARISAQIGCSIKTLERKCRAQTGLGPAQLYSHIRLSEIRQMLEATPLPITEIALRCGYESPSSMTRAFKAKYHLTPRALRAQSAKFTTPR